MNSQTYDLILRMRDQATAVWQKTQSSISGGISRLGRMFTDLRTLIAGAFAVKIVKDFINASNEQERASAQLAQALRNISQTGGDAQKQMEAFSSSLQKVTTFGDETITKVQTMLVAMTGSTYRVDELTKATLDLASGLGMDAESVAQLIGKTLEGQDALGRYGISTKDAKDETEKLNSIIRQAREKFGGFAENEAKTAAGQMKQFANAVGDLQEELGDMMKEALLPFVTFLNDNIPTIRATVISMVEGVSAAFNTLVAGIAGIAWAWNSLLALMGNDQAKSDAVVWARVWDESLSKIKSSGDEIRNVWKSTQEEAPKATTAVEVYTRQVERASAAYLRLELHTSRAMLKISEAAVKETGKVKEVVVKNFNWIKEAQEDWAKDAQETMQSSMMIVQGMISSITEGVQNAFSGSEAAGKNFFKALLIAAVDTLQAYIVAAAAFAWAKGIFSFGTTLIEDLAFIATATAMLQTAKGYIAKMHTGGTAYVDGPPSREVPVMVRGGETLRVTTEDQERERKDSRGNTIIFNFNSPIPSGRWVVDSVKEELRRVGVTVDKLLVNTKPGISLA